jgi:hypothetical protein
MLGLGGFFEMLTDARLLSLVVAMPRLRHLGIGSCVQLTVKGLADVFCECVGLEMLSAQELSQIGEEEWKEVLFPLLPKLHSVNLADGRHSNKFEDHLARKYNKRHKQQLNW